MGDRIEPLSHFKSGAFGILYFSRGRGRGHALPDIAIGTELAGLCVNTDVRYASYSSGADAFRSRGYAVIDLQMNDDPGALELMIKQARLIGCLRPRLVIGHEEFFAAPMAHIFGIPSVIITDFFLDPSSLFMVAMQYANEIIFTAERGLFTEPPFIGHKVIYVGPAIRRFSYGRMDRERARLELGFPQEAIVVLCQPGTWSEDQVPIAELISAAWDALSYPMKRLIWVACRDFSSLQLRFRGRSDIEVISEDPLIDRLIVASDLVITKANRMTVYEAASFGAPSISISTGVNWPDDVAVLRVPSNTALDARGLTAIALAKLMTDRIRSGWVKCEALPKWDGVAVAARRIISQVERIESDE